MFEIFLAIIGTLVVGGCIVILASVAVNAFLAWIFKGEESEAVEIMGEHSEVDNGGKPLSMKDDYLDWEKIKEGDFVAIDSSGDIFFYRKKAPHVDIGDGMWCTDKDGIWVQSSDKVPDSAIIGPLPPWKESLRVRPGYVEKRE